MSVRNTCPSESELLALAALVRRGTIQAAAEERCLSRHTIDRHLDRLRERSGAHQIPQLVGWAVACGYLIIKPKVAHDADPVSSRTPAVVIEMD